MMDSVELLVRILNEAFERKSWHGTNLKGSIRGLTFKHVSWRPQPERHNIWEHVLHCAYWKYTVRRRLTGEKRGSFSLKGSNWFERPVPGCQDQSAWDDSVELLTETHRSLVAVIQSLSPDQLNKPAAGGETSILTLITGIAAHDTYHAGQIQLLKKLMNAKKS
ncbi:MAG: DinB family protein [Planctomycetaceae bacterium]|nr:DinB family protein [Planctomycetaceae bacterium]